MRRPYLTASRMAELQRSIGPRDQAIVSTLDDLRVATTGQLARLHFSDLTEGSAARQAPRVLRRLEDLGIVTRLERQVGGIRAGSQANIWSLDLAGQRLASTCGPAGGRTCRRPWTPGLAFLAHRLAVSECYVELVERCRTADAELLEFYAEPYCWRRYAAPLGGTATLKPDAFARLALGDFERGAFVEIDRNTESRSTLKRKLATYRHYWESGREQERRGYFPQVVFSVPSEERKEVLIDLCAAQPNEVWPLFRVVLEPELTDALLEGEAS
jgi:Replication-relaxation